MGLWNNLKRLMDARNLTLKHMARDEGGLTDVSRNTLSFIYNNKTTGIEYEKLEALLRFLQVTPNAFFQFDPPLAAMSNTVEALSPDHGKLLDILSAYGLAAVVESGASQMLARLMESRNNATGEEKQQIDDTITELTKTLDKLGL